MPKTKKRKDDDFIIMKEKGLMDMKGSVPIWEKFVLTINEAAQYFNIGEKKIRKLAEDYVDYGFILQNGTKTLIKRKKFEEFMNETNMV